MKEVTPGPRSSSRPSHQIRELPVAGQRHDDSDKVKVVTTATGGPVSSSRPFRTRIVNYLPQPGDTRISKKLKVVTKATGGGGLFPLRGLSPQVRDLPVSPSGST